MRKCRKSGVSSSRFAASAKNAKTSGSGRGTCCERSKRWDDVPAGPASAERAGEAIGARQAALRQAPGTASPGFTMGMVYAAIDASLPAFICAQHVFFVAPAPLAADGRLTLSPKGLDSFAILDPHTVAYLDLTGSGVETIAHLR